MVLLDALASLKNTAKNVPHYFQVVHPRNGGSSEFSVYASMEGVEEGVEEGVGEEANAGRKEGCRIWELRPATTT